MNQMTVLITGTSKGIGEATAKAFLDEGYHVIATGRAAPSWKVPSSQETLLDRVSLDILNEKAVDKIIKEYSDKGHPVQILVNNAGASIGAPISEMTTEIWKNNFSVNTDGTFFCTRAVVSILLQKNLPGSIINIASIAGKNAFANTCAYCAAKAAVIGFTKSLSIELGPSDITVNAICPGSVKTPMIQDVINDLAVSANTTTEDIRTQMVESIPMRRFQSPQDIAALAVFLASQSARNINGEAINVDGGVVRD